MVSLFAHTEANVNSIKEFSATTSSLYLYMFLLPLNILVNLQSSRHYFDLIFCSMSGS